MRYAMILLAVLAMAAVGSASPINVLNGVPWTSNAFFLPAPANGTNAALTFTDGNTATRGFVLGPVVYDLGIVTPFIGVVGVATDDNAFTRGNPMFVTVSFSNDLTFTTGVTTDVVPLADQGAEQQVSIPTVAARYVRFVFPSTPGIGTNFYADSPPLATPFADGFVVPSELELFQVPEPGSLSLSLGPGRLGGPWAADEEVSIVESDQD